MMEEDNTTKMGRCNLEIISEDSAELWRMIRTFGGTYRKERDMSGIRNSYNKGSEVKYIKSLKSI